MVRVTGRLQYQFAFDKPMKTRVLYTNTVPEVVDPGLHVVHLDITRLLMKSLLHSAFYVSRCARRMNMTLIGYFSIVLGG